MITFDKCGSFKGKITVPADKSITHRAVILSAMAGGVSVINNPLNSRDTLATIDAFKAMGVDIIDEQNRLIVKSGGYRGFKEPQDIINCENSGTTARLLTGVFAPQPFFTVMTGDNSLKKRPMARVIKPLKAMGADIRGRKDNTLLPICILPAKMRAEDTRSEVKSAQVKSAVLLAALQIEGESGYFEPIRTRDHSERMMKGFGADIKTSDGLIVIHGGLPLTPVEITVPGDFSSAAFFIAAALSFEGSEVIIDGCGLNPSRTGLLDALKNLGADIRVDIKVQDPEPIGDIYINYQKLKGGKISGDITANLIDEVPVLAFMGLFAEDAIEIRDVAELRVKESDRISAVAENFRAMGAEVEEFEDGLKVYPLKTEPQKALLKSFDDHRICMVNILLAKKFGMKLMIDDIAPLDVSFPDFIDKVFELEAKGN